jgi:hypothetical protein
MAVAAAKAARITALALVIGIPLLPAIAAGSILPSGAEEKGSSPRFQLGQEASWKPGTTPHPKTVLRLPDLDQPNRRFSTASVRRVFSENMARHGRQENRSPAWQLADARTVPATQERPDVQQLKGKRGRTLLTVLPDGALRRHDTVTPDFGHIQQREEHWAIVDLKGQSTHTRTKPDAGLG